MEERGWDLAWGSPEVDPDRSPSRIRSLQLWNFMFWGVGGTNITQDYFNCVFVPSPCPLRDGAIFIHILYFRYNLIIYRTLFWRRISVNIVRVLATVFPFKDKVRFYLKIKSIAVVFLKWCVAEPWMPENTFIVHFLSSFILFLICWRMLNECFLYGVWIATILVL